MNNDSNSLSGFSDMNWEQARAMLHGLFEMLPDGVVLIDPQNNYIIVDCNAAYASMNGYSVHELIGEPSASLLGADSYEGSVISPDNKLPLAHTSLPFLEQVRQASVLTSRIIHRRKDGSLFPIEFRASLISIGGHEFILGVDRDVSSQEHFEKIQKSEIAMRAIFDASPVGIVLVNIENDAYQIYDCNFAYSRMNGYTRDELIGQPIGMLDCSREEARIFGLDLVEGDELIDISVPRDLTVGGTFNNPTAWHKRKDGVIIAIEYYSTVVLIDGKKMLLGIDRDITQHRREERLDYNRNRVLELIATRAPFEQSLSSLEILVEDQLVDMHCAFLVADLPKTNGRATFSLSEEHCFTPDLAMRPAWSIPTQQRHSVFKDMALEESALLQRAIQHPYDLPMPIYLGQNLDANFGHTNNEFAHDALLTALGGAKRCWLRSVIGNQGVLGVLVLWSDSTAPNSQNQHGKGLANWEDRFEKVLKIALRMATIAIEQHSMSQRLAFQAENDLLTGLPNRYLFEDRLTHALKHAKRRKMRLALLFLDLDGFKTVNDTWGHLCGDCILQEVALRIRNCVRASDTVARLGGDEFTVILSDIENDSDAEKVVGKISEALSQPFFVEGQQTQITASIGIAFAPDNGDTLQKLMRNADSAMYQAKERGKNRYEVHCNDLRDTR